MCKSLGNFSVNNDDCWLWNKKLNPSGYPLVYFNYRFYAPHRVIYKELYGSVPNRVRKICRIRKCINPAHLEEYIYHKPRGVEEKSWLEKLYKKLVAYF